MVEPVWFYSTFESLLLALGQLSTKLKRGSHSEMLMQFVWSVAQPQEIRELLKYFQCVARVGDLCPGHSAGRDRPGVRNGHRL